jgi:uncharacterized protein YuzE
MELVNLQIGPVIFDHADYDAEHDILYLSVGEPQAADAQETPEGHAIRYAPGTNRIVGLTVLGPRWIIEHEGKLTVTFPEIVETRSAEDVADLLVAA